MLQSLINLFKDSQSLKKNFLARRWGPAKARACDMCDMKGIHVRDLTEIGVQVCERGEGAICFVSKPPH
jgi:hypothetical protein